MDRQRSGGAQRTRLTIRFPAINSWIFLIGVDDDAAIRKALGTPWNRVRWDEAQRIPSKFTTTIRETMLVALLDYGGEFLMTGTAERRMSGMFYDVTRNDSKLTGWDVHRWTMIQNPFWGRAKQINGQWFTVWTSTMRLSAVRTNRSNCRLRFLPLDT